MVEDDPPWQRRHLYKGLPLFTRDRPSFGQAPPLGDGGFDHLLGQAARSAPQFCDELMACLPN
eukprot:11198120-Lingulodinium_polyedra.AAC.1